MQKINIITYLKHNQKKFQDLTPEEQQLLKEIGPEYCLQVDYKPAFYDGKWRFFRSREQAKYFVDWRVYQVKEEYLRIQQLKKLVEEGKITFPNTEEQKRIVKNFRKES